MAFRYPNASSERSLSIAHRMPITQHIHSMNEGRAGAASHEDDNKTPRYLEQTSGGSSSGNGARCSSKVTYGFKTDTPGADWSCG
jgi:hypothetical protein